MRAATLMSHWAACPVVVEMALPRKNPASKLMSWAESRRQGWLNHPPRRRVEAVSSWLRRVFCTLGTGRLASGGKEWVWMGLGSAQGFAQRVAQGVAQGFER